MAPVTYLAARLIDGNGAEPIDNAFLTLDDGVIANLGRQNDLGSAAAGAIDLGDATLLPGLVNMHAHLTCTAGTRVLHDALHDSYEIKMMRAVENARRSIESGVTTLRDCGTQNSIIFAVRDASQAGLIAAPHIWASGEVLTSTGGHCYFFGVECDSETDIKRAVRRQVKAGADYIKVMTTGGRLTPNSSPQHSQFNTAEMCVLTEDSARLGKYVASHCLGTSGVVSAVESRVRTIEHCAFLSEDGPEVVHDARLADAIADRGIYVCPTIGAGERNRQRAERAGEMSEHERRSRQARLESIAQLRAAGVKLISGNDAGMALTMFDDFQLDLELMVEHIGLSPVEAIQTATGLAAEAIGSNDFGILKHGARADVLAVRGDAADDISALREILLVLKSGTAMVDRLPVA